MEKRRSLQQMVLGTLESHMQKNETGPFSYTIHKDKLQMDERPRCETGIHQNPRGEHRQQPLQHLPKQTFHDTAPKARATKDKMNLWDFIKIKSFCTAKETVQKLRCSPRNGTIYMQMMLEIKDWYPSSTKNFSNSICEKKINKS